MVEALKEGSKSQTRRIGKSNIKDGDILWVRETYHQNHADLDLYLYKADNIETSRFIKWLPSIFMPKKACRFFLKVKSIKKEFLNDITESDAVAEGCPKYGPFGEYRGSYHPRGGCMRYRAYSSAKRAFQCVWESINGEKSWKKNPEVTVIEFERIDKPADFIV